MRNFMLEHGGDILSSVSKDPRLSGVEAMSYIFISTDAEWEISWFDPGHDNMADNQAIIMQ